MAVQHVPEPGWYPTQELGQQNGQYAAENATSVGLPAGMNIWLDLEGVNSGASATDVSAYCNAWFGVVASVQYVPGLYIGADAILDNQQLDARAVFLEVRQQCRLSAAWLLLRVFVSGNRLLYGAKHQRQR
jgi:hypothetical protein